MGESVPRDEFPRTPARQAVVSVVRGYGLVQRLMGPYFSQFGLTPPQFQMLTVLSGLQSKPVTQRRLAQALYVSFPNITAMLARLEEAGLIMRRVNPNDGREKFVQLTPKARALLRRIWRAHSRQLELVTAGLDDRERLELARLINKLIAAHDATAEVPSHVGATASEPSGDDVL